jgi:hypothetical protein
MRFAGNARNVDAGSDPADRPGSRALARSREEVIAMQPILSGMIHAVGTTLVASCMNAPLTWSPDGRWLAYTTIERTAPAELRAGWLFDSLPAAGRTLGPLGSPGRQAELGPARHKIWATERGTLSSVLIEDSRAPLSSPCWSPDGHSMSYLRFVPRTPLNELTPARGTCEVVVQEAIDRRRVVASLPEIELDPDQMQEFVELCAPWSPDGQMLAVPRPGPAPAVLIVRVDRGAVVRTLDSARGASWSPDGSKLAFYRPGRGGDGTSLSVVGQDSGPGRRLLEVGEATALPVWSPDGQSIVAISRRPGAHGREIDLVRIGIESGFATRILPLGTLAPDVHGRGRMALGIEGQAPDTSHRASLGCDREGEEFVLSIDVDGQLPVVRYGNLRRGMILKPFHPLDLSLRIGALALPPDSQVVAVRIETSGGLSLPLLCDLANESVRLIAPDRPALLEWTSTLVGTARTLLASAIPPASLDGRNVERASPLPIPGEVPDQSPFLLRLRRIGKIGSGLLERPAGAAETPAGGEPTADPAEDELRLFFDYLRNDHRAAEADLDVIESRATSPQMRLRILGVRAQVLAAAGQADRARPIVDYLTKTQGAGRRLVESTPLGPAFSRVDDPAALWPRYLAQVLERNPHPAMSAPDSADDRIGGVDLPLPRRFGAGPPDGAVLPPFFRGRDGAGPLLPGPIDGPFDPPAPPRFFPPPAPRPVQPMQPMPRTIRRPSRPLPGR